MPDITSEMIEATYDAAQSVYTGTTAKRDAVKNLVQNTGMTSGSANGYISTVIKMLKGKPYGRTIRAKAVHYFLANIRRDYGIDKFSNALHSVKMHLETNQNPQHNVWEVINGYEEIYYQSQNFSSPDEITDDETLNEGAKKQITVNAYERNSQARAKCIEHHGLDCKICGFNFAKVYGAIGEGYIHVHHIKPLSEIGENYEVDPLNDLIPVCPNCHAMLHRQKPAYRINELKENFNRNN